MQCKEIQCKSACHKINSPYLPFHWDLNIYRGCSHGCKYCYALYSHQYLQEFACQNYFRDILVKTNVVEKLEQQLQKASWKREVINIGGVTDSYQPIEKKYQLMPEILKLLIKYKTPCIISTKSDLILRDYDLIMQLAKVAYVNICATITCYDNQLQKQLEPGACSSARRLEMLRTFAPTPVCTGMHIMPIIPFITDSRENLQRLYGVAKEAGISYVLPGMLNLKGPTRVFFFDFVREAFPAVYQKLFHLYQEKEGRRQYRNELYQQICQLEKEYELGRSFPDYDALVKSRVSSPEDYQQITLF